MIRLFNCRSNKLLGGAIFDLFFKETIIPSTYTVNDPENVPPLKRTTTVESTITVPDAQAIELQPTPPTYTYEYQTVDVPSAEEVEWILPRTDNDYIYFRDYNIGTTGTQDKQSFNDSASTSNGAHSQNANRSWLWTGYETNVHGQREEIRYDHQYWYAAQFSAPGKETKQYAVWERFLDTYNNQDTVIWKIQPPDGYTEVMFLLYKGDNCIRTTQKFKFKLGTVYHKTSYGTWKMEHGNECYFNVPVEGEKYWSTYYGKSGAPDKRQNYSSITDKLPDGTFSDIANGKTAEPRQADRYTPTEQKIVFHCNSKVVWHNIHIEFFTTDSSKATNSSSSAKPKLSFASAATSGQ